MVRISKQYSAIFLLITGALVTALLCRFFWSAGRSHTTLGYRDGVLFGGAVPIQVSIAATPAAREQGLSGTTSLPPHSGKLFIFEASGRPGFWMKGMHYPLDIVWIDETMHVVAVSAHLLPESYPQVYVPPSPVRYVLELAADTAAQSGLYSGTVLTLAR